MDELAGGSGNDSEWEDYDGEGGDEEMDEASAVAQAKAVAASLRSGQAGASTRGSGGEHRMVNVTVCGWMT